MQESHEELDHSMSSQEELDHPLSSHEELDHPAVLQASAVLLQASAGRHGGKGRFMVLLLASAGRHGAGGPVACALLWSCRAAAKLGEKLVGSLSTLTESISIKLVAFTWSLASRSTSRFR